MPPRPRTGLTEERKTALRTELRIFMTAAQRAEEDLRVYVYMANEAGMTFRDIGDALGVSPNTARLWKVEGEQARERRRGGDPGGSGEHPILG